LKNNGNAFVHLESPDVVLGAMYGDAGFTFPVNVEFGMAGGLLAPAFLGRGKMVRRGRRNMPIANQNTTISALITLRSLAIGMMQYRAMVREFPNLSIDATLAAAAERFPKFDLDERRLGVIVWENAVARIPLPRELFTGSYDKRWGVEGGSQKIVFCGEGLTELE
jgi:hypothetical protein